MSTSLGVIDGRLLPFARPKKWFLAFDQLAVIDFHGSFGKFRTFYKDQHAINDIQWLADQEFVYEPRIDNDEMVRLAETQGLAHDPHWIEFVKRARAAGDAFDREAFANVLRSGTPQEKHDALGNWLIWLHQSGSLGSQFWASLLAQPGVDTIPIVGDLLTVPQADSRLAAGMQVIVSKLPQPDDSTPWDDLLEFKNDPDTRLKYTELRRWLRATASEGPTLVELQDEIEWLCAQFEDHMKRARLSVTRGPVEWIVRTPLEILEELLKGKYADLARRAFSVKYQEIALREAERSAPGRELAFVMKARDRFGESA
jgi:hypothetical protein